MSRVKEIFYFSSLVLIFIISCFYFVGHQGHLLIDCGREAYFPEQMLKGKVLFKDIFALFGPLSYQINAFLYKLYGVNLKTLYYAGIANAFIILTVYYMIARKVTSEIVSWLACFLLMGICIFHSFIPNYIFPYSYAIIYALSSFLISVLFGIYYLEKSKPVFLIISALFMGISAVAKTDFILFFGILFLIAIYFKPIPKKDLVFFILAFLLVPVISWGEVFYRGLNFNEFLNYFHEMRDFVDSFFFKYFYAKHTGLYPSSYALHKLWDNSRIFLFNIFIDFAVFFLFFWGFSKISPSKIKAVIQVICFIILYIVFPKEYFKNIGESVSLAWLAVSTTIILLLCFRDKILAFIAIAGIIASLKSYFFINLHIFGTFLIPLLILVNLVFIFDKIPGYFKFIPEKQWKQTWFTVIFLLGIVFFSTNAGYALKQNDRSIETGKGQIYIGKKWGTNTGRLVDYINREVPKNSSFLVMPEGIMINFLTNREGDSWYHTFTPHFLDVYGEDKVIEHIKAKKYDFIFITNQDTKDFYLSFFCRDYAEGICNYIQRKYKYIRRFDGPGPDDEYLWVDIYKRK